MKKLFIIIMGIINFYLFIIGFYFSVNQDFSFREVDMDSNNILTISELNYYLNTDIRYMCVNDKGKYIYLNNQDITNTKQCQQIIMELYSLKDGLMIKEIVIEQK